ncbi:MAG: cyclic nucleotide-binding/CBS domain-containing protein [Nitrospirae bacterium]|nr:cyclic nucleotide-binding/CBS domain-containing protein [Nitrospirota bacterium]
MLFEDVIDFFKNIPPFQFLEEAVIRDIAGSVSMEFYPKGSVILRQDGPASDSLRIIKKGGVKISMRSGTNEDVDLDYRGEGESFGLVSLVGKEKQKTTIVAIDDTVCYLLDKQKVFSLIESQPTFTEFFLQSHFTKYMDKTCREMRSKSSFQGSSDHILLTTQVGEIANNDVISIEDGSTIQDAALAMSKHKVSSVVILGSDALPCGIVTDRDLREKVVAKGRDVRETVKNIMNLPLIRVDAKDYCFEAVLKMLKYNIHHLLVIKDGALKSVITNHDILLLQGKSPLSLAKDIDSQQTIKGLIPVSRKINSIVGFLLKEGARAGNIIKIVSELNDRLVKRVLDIAERKFGPSPVPWCWVVFGSEGRGEQIFKTDQDNALIYADTTSAMQEEAAHKYFSDLTAFVKDGLEQCGFPPCPAHYMASNPQWRQPLRTWRKYFSDWVTRPTAEAILNSLIFFDFRPLYGDFSLAEDLRSYLAELLEGQEVFLGYLANTVVHNRPPLGFLKSFVVEKSGEHKDELNLKIKGIMPLVDIVRLFALERDVRDSSTLGRIAELRNKHTIIREHADEIEHSFEFITLLTAHHQAKLLEEGKAIDNFINPNNLSNLEKKTIKDAFQLIAGLQDSIVELYKAFIW